jgi:hypothetical protein
MSDPSDAELSIAMRRILTYAQEQLPGSILCILSFTSVERDEQQVSINKIIANVEDRGPIVAASIEVLKEFLSAPVYDLRDVQGGMQ